MFGSTLLIDFRICICDFLSNFSLRLSLDSISSVIFLKENMAEVGL